jgi:hypothetical protein
MLERYWTISTAPTLKSLRWVAEARPPPIVPNHVAIHPPSRSERRPPASEFLQAQVSAPTAA